jgi:hypothetical protein
LFANVLFNVTRSDALMLSRISLTRVSWNSITLLLISA